LSDVDVHVLIKLIRKFGMEFRSALIFDRIKEELRNFCANHTIDEASFKITVKLGYNELGYKEHLVIMNEHFCLVGFGHFHDQNPGYKKFGRSRAIRYNL